MVELESYSYSNGGRIGHTKVKDNLSFQIHHPHIIHIPPSKVLGIDDRTALRINNIKLSSFLQMQVQPRKYDKLIVSYSHIEYQGLPTRSERSGMQIVR